MFLTAEAEDAGGLSPAKDDNEGWRKQTPQIMLFLGVTDYQVLFGGHPASTGTK